MIAVAKGTSWKVLEATLIRNHFKCWVIISVRCFIEVWIADRGKLA